MKARFSALDIAFLIEDLRTSLIGLRVDQVYDIDNKTFLIRLTASNVKKILLLESGIRFHVTTFEWPKNSAPSGFSMKLRKHLNNKRLEKIQQLDQDRIIILEFGADVCKNYLILELYDKGNMILTDYKYSILYVLRAKINDGKRLHVNDVYKVEPVEKFLPDEGSVLQELKNSDGKPLRSIFLHRVDLGPALFHHCFTNNQLDPSTKVKADSDDLTEMAHKISKALKEGYEILQKPIKSGGFITCFTQKVNSSVDGDSEVEKFYNEFHPSVIISSYKNKDIISFDDFNAAVDEFFSKVEAQKILSKQINMEKSAFKKLEKVKQDQSNRLQELRAGQESNIRKAELISCNHEIVDAVINVVRMLLASQVSWNEISEHLVEEKQKGDLLASKIHSINFVENKVVVLLSDPYEENSDQEEISIDLNLSAQGNAKKYYDYKKASAKKEERTIESQEKAIKSTEKKMKASLKEAATIQSIKRLRKIMWFEKFKWFISSDNYLVIAGRDAQQNELLVKRYLKPKDLYFHTDAHGSASVIVKNENPAEVVPPKTINEACTFTVCCSNSWETKVMSTTWWVYGDQVSKSAPTGEYLPTGSFMVRGKRNYLVPTQLVLGFGVLFRSSETSDIPANENISEYTDEATAGQECVNNASQLTLEAHSEALPPVTLDGGNHVDDHENNVENAPEGKNDSIDTVNASGSTQNAEFQKENKNVEPSRVNENTEDAFNTEDYPETEVKLSTGNESNKAESGSPRQDEQYVISCADAPHVNSNKKKGKQNKSNTKAAAEKNQKPEPTKKTQHPEKAVSAAIQKTKRGQHGRMKKLHNKYKHQDEGERELRLKILQEGSEVVSNDNDVDDKKLNSEEMTIVHTESQTDSEEKGSSKPTRDFHKGKNLTENPSVEETENDDPSNLTVTEMDVLKYLKGSPKEEDELLYAVPVVAPYGSLQSYKYKAKLLPGTMKRGKASKSAFEAFIRLKESTTREKNLIKGIKEQDISRNFPGKTKIFLPK